MLTLVVALAVAWSLWHQFMFVGFGEWIGPKVKPPSQVTASGQVPFGPGKPKANDNKVRGTYLVNGRTGSFWPEPFTPAAGKTILVYEDHPVVAAVLIVAAMFLILCTAFAVEIWSRARFRMTIFSILLVTALSAVAFSLYLPYEGSAWSFIVRLPMFLALGICPLAWLLAIWKLFGAIARPRT
ncbi:MAG: hypothetical protein DWQ42_01575 [Planctomycetota bacterium]|nr:MAG: hypothetical protein DWQ42_01575 [Planctomycetota bacterium]